MIGDQYEIIILVIQYIYTYMSYSHIDNDLLL